MDEFKDIAFGDDSYVAEFMAKYKNRPELKVIMEFAYPNKSVEERIAILQDCKNTYEFHRDVLKPALDTLLKLTSSGLTSKGVEDLDKKKHYVYISNHRDIIMDVCLVNYLLLQHDVRMCASAIGDNLVSNEFLEDFASVNRNFLVLRNLPPRQALLESKRLSKYIAHLLNDGNHSIWIAQREGRAKNGDDRTQAGLLKMLSLNADRGEDSMEYLKNLHIVPVAISYEWDATDTLKLPSLVAEKNNLPYHKGANEDYNHILNGIKGGKGAINISFGEELITDFEDIETTLPTNKKLQKLANTIDSKIFSLYHLWPSNYLAYDILNHSKKYFDQYTEDYKEIFLMRMQKAVEPFDNQEQAKQIFLSMYANSVINKEVEVQES